MIRNILVNNRRAIFDAEYPARDILEVFTCLDREFEDYLSVMVF